MDVTGGLHIMYMIGLLCLAVGIFLHLVGISTAQWSVTDGEPTIYYGLWDKCIGESCSEYSDDFMTASIGVCQAFAIIGMVLGGVTLIMCLVFALMSMLKKTPRKIVPLVAMVVAATSLISILICVVTWAAGAPMRHQVRHEYSFALSIVGGISIATGGVLVFLGSK